MEAASVTIREARDSDAKEVLALLEAGSLESAYDPREFVVATQEGRVVACARLRTFDTGAHELASVAVARSHRRAGLGTRIVRAALARAKGAVYALAVAPGFFSSVGFARMIVMPEELRAKADGICASTGAVAMRWAPTGAAAVEEIKRRYAAASSREECCPPYMPYDAREIAALPHGAQLSLGTGNPVREARMREGETVVDLGSGGGIDVLLAAKVVGPKGRVIGIDFTPEMVAKARANAAEAGIGNVEFHESPIETIPLADAIADVVISNCVINLSIDKPGVLREAHRVLRAGGRFVVSDTTRAEDVALSVTPSCDCVTGALTTAEWRALLAQAGFVDVSLEAGAPLAGVATATVRARKP